MRSIIVHVPHFVSCDVADVKAKVTEENMKILRGDEVPATAFIDVRDLVGDPDSAFSCDVCDMLTELNVLSKHDIPDRKGLYHYEWSHVPFTALSEESLSIVA